MNEKECVICGKLFQPRRVTTICCSEVCTRERNKVLNRWNKRMKTKRLKEAKSKRKLTLTEISILATQAGMTYGEYIARTEGGMR